MTVFKTALTLSFLLGNVLAARREGVIVVGTTGYGANSCTVLLVTLGSSKVAYIGGIFSIYYLLPFFSGQEIKKSQNIIK